MELWQARYFLAVADGLSFRGAAARLNVSQPPLSRAVARLEQELGVALFDRSGRRIALTEAGEAFRREAALLIAQAARAVDAARGQAGPVRSIAVGFEGSSVYDLVPRAVGRLHGQDTGLRIRLADMTTPAQVRALVDGSLDLGFVVPPVRHPALVVTEVWRDVLAVALPPGHRLAGQARLHLADLAEEPFVTGSRDDQCGLHLQVMALCRTAGFVPRVALDVNDVGMVLGFVAAGMGVAVLPASVMAGTDAQVAAVPLGLRTMAGLAVAYRRGDAAPAVRALVAAAVELGTIPA